MATRVSKKAWVIANMLASAYSDLQQRVNAEACEKIAEYRALAEAESADDAKASGHLVPMQFVDRRSMLDQIEGAMSFDELWEIVCTFYELVKEKHPLLYKDRKGIHDVCSALLSVSDVSSATSAMVSSDSVEPTAVRPNSDEPSVGTDTSVSNGDGSTVGFSSQELRDMSANADTCRVGH